MEDMVEIGSFYFKDTLVEVQASGPTPILRRIAIVVGLRGHCQIMPAYPPKKQPSDN